MVLSTHLRIVRQLALPRLQQLRPANARWIHFSLAAAVQNHGSLTQDRNYPPHSRPTYANRFAGQTSVRRLSSTQSDSQVVLEPSGLQTESFHARDMFKESVNSVEPLHMVQNVLHYEKKAGGGGVLKVNDKAYVVKKNIYVVGFGKAVLGMARATEDILGEHIVSGILSIPRGQRKVLQEKGKEHLLLLPESKIKVCEGGRFSYPDETAHETALEITKLLTGKKPTDLFIVLISGGGSSLLPCPEPPILLDEIITMTKMLTRAGATNADKNVVRKTFETLKGGKMIDVAAPAKIVSLIISDTVGDTISQIASGPTVHDPVTAHHCFQIFKRYNVVDKVPQTIMTFLKEKMDEETIRVSLKNPGSLSTMTKSGGDDVRKQREAQVQNVLVGSNSIACLTAARRAEELGHQSYVLTTGVQGEARKMGAILGKLGTFIAMSFDRQLASSLPFSLLSLELNLVRSGITKNQINDITELVDDSISIGKNAVIVCGGQTVIDLRVVGGIGGRNCEVCLGAAIEMQKLFQNEQPRPNPAITLLSADTDGQDGPDCPAAGAIVNENFVIEAQLDGHDCQEYLDNNNSYAVFNAVKGGSHLVVTGMTETNVLDIQILVVRNPLNNIH